MAISLIDSQANKTTRVTQATTWLRGAPNGRLLLAEDNPVHQTIATKMLAVAGYDVDTVADGAAAVHAVAGGPYDVVLMDCKMPALDGFQATAAIRRLRSSARLTPIIAVTACIGEEDRERCLNEGMDDYIAKPINKEALLAMVGQVLNRSRKRTSHIPNPNRSEEEDVILDLRMFEELRLLGDGGDQYFLAQLVDEFVRETESLVIELRCALERGDSRSVGRIAHTMAGSADQLGGRRLARSCGRLEEKAKARHLMDGQDDASEIENDFQSLCRTLIHELASTEHRRAWSPRG
jgi:CheY-like chemotaxis protein/HPt (histidine-containing phosphotransfer) domain-containing protein